MVTEEVLASYDKTGELSQKTLIENLEGMPAKVTGLETYKENLEKGNQPIWPMEFKVDGYDVTVDADGDVTVEGLGGGSSGGVALKPDSTDVLEEPTTFSTEYGTIDVIWLSDTGKTVADTPNAPVLYASDNPNEKLTPVKFNEETSEWDEYKTNDNNWYNYQAGNTERQEGTKLVNNQSSKWANAMTPNESYFVWIPRYAYRITYYESETSTEPTGYYDGYGMWNAETKKVNYELDKGIETVTSNGKTYIVHPAFTKSVDNGGWSSPLPGFWFAKFEMSGDSSENLRSVNGVASEKQGTIGEYYTRARGAKFGYTNGVQDTDGNTSFMSSHMVKNSEWGAVAYLTHSQYGRNGNAIDKNLDMSSFTGGGGGTSYTTNKLQSSTGNVYGIYDMSGGNYERTAAFGRSSDTLINGTSFATKGGSSTKYATAYTIASNEFKKDIYEVGKVGDATKETFDGSGHNWFSGHAARPTTGSPFFTRGGGHGDVFLPCLFSCSCDTGAKTPYDGFRVALCP